jgi:YHS domain-containing protein
MKKIMALTLLLMSHLSFAADAVYTGYFSNKALGGYDTVSYFTDNEPAKGSSKYTTKYKGADWYFVSQTHLDLFKAEPEKYAPQYGGYCAWALSANNSFASGDPTQWAIVDNKLYLNYDKSVKAKWDAKRAFHIVQADRNWPALIAE